MVHNKPGYDPCELFFGWPPLSVSRDTRKIHGAHGNTGAGYEVAWASSLALDPAPASFLDLAKATQTWMENRK